MSYVVAVIGATGNVGREMLNILAERNFPVARGCGCLAPQPGQRGQLWRQDAEMSGAGIL